MTHPSVNSIVERLEPCPFCGSEAITLAYRGQPATDLYMMCQDCEASGPTLHRNNGHLVATRWNTRPAATIISELQAERDEADRRAGRAERSLNSLESAERTRRRCLQEWKADEGFGDSTPFDDVWEKVRQERDEALSSLSRIREETIEVKKNFNKWYAQNYADADGKFTHMPSWAKGDMRKAWEAAIRSLDKNCSGKTGGEG